jgi:alanyl-tRNA synthetase
MHSNEIRQAFLEYFTKLEHDIVPSSSLVPVDDPTLLFTNAGMVQFKEVFLGNEIRPYTRAVSAQRCVRAGGKHNDLENVGYTKRHHTFFEMLGNFSFGDYFKSEAIGYAWDFLTKVLKIPAEKLWVSVYKDDDESAEIWLKEIGVSAGRLSRCGEADNFWSMGDTGPCGPCTEIFYDHGPEITGGPPGSPDQDGDRYVEIWNLVFMQFNKDIQGKFTPLPKPCVDTGMGLERIAAVMQGVHDNYDIHAFRELLQALSELIGFDNIHDTSMRVVVDHIRSTAFLIADGITPSNEGRGYVLRRIIRRAARHGYKLGQNEPFFYKLVPSLVKLMGAAYPELVTMQKMIEQVIKQEEIQFSNTLSNGLKIFDQEIAHLTSKEIPGETVFLLYDTYGFPPDLTADIARERDMTIDYKGFHQAMAKQRAQSQQAQHFSVDYTTQLHINDESEFVGYEKLVAQGTVLTLLHENDPVEKLTKGQSGVVILDQTPFYAESGGQVGDTGYLDFADGQFRVNNTRKKGKAILHYGEVLKGELKTKIKIEAKVDANRQAIVLNHSATHLLHEALRRVLGEHVVQKGSLVEAKRLRFDFAHPQPLTENEISQVEQIVNQQIQANLSSSVTEGTLAEAKEKGALALFGEKYGDKVRVVKMGDFSTEVCGGTHVEHTGEIGLFKIISESACASGVRRVEALTGLAALDWVRQQQRQINQIARTLKSDPAEISDKVDQLLTKNKELSKDVARLKDQIANLKMGAGVSNLQTEKIGDITLIIDAPQDVSGTNELRIYSDKLKQKCQQAGDERFAIILTSISEDNKIQMVASVSKSCLEFFAAPELLNFVAKQVGGKAGGRPDFAQGGGNDPAKLNEALAEVSNWIEKKFSTIKG